MVNNYVYKSELKDELIKLVEYKHSQNIKFNGEDLCRRLDIFLLNNFPNRKRIDTEIVNKWFEKGENESFRYWYDRMSFLKQFSIFIKDYLNENKLLEKDIITFMSRRIVKARKIYSEEEIKILLENVDAGNFETLAVNHKKQIVLTLSVIIRTMFCTGLSIEEILSLDVEDVDLENGIILVYNEDNPTKNRQVPINNEVLNLLKMYSKKCHKDSIFLDPFFYNLGTHVRIPVKREREYMQSLVSNTTISFEKKRKYFEEPFKRIRNTFIITRLYEWLKDGKNIPLKEMITQRYIGGNKIRNIEYYMRVTSQIYPQISDIVNKYVKNKDDDIGGNVLYEE